MGEPRNDILPCLVATLNRLNDGWQSASGLKKAKPLHRSRKGQV